MGATGRGDPGATQDTSHWVPGMRGTSLTGWEYRTQVSQVEVEGLGRHQ